MTPRQIRWLSAFVVGLLLGMAAATSVQAQARPGLSGAAVVLVRDDVRAQLAARWDSIKVGDPERLYCAIYATDTTASRALVYTVFAALPAVMDSSSPTRTYGTCPIRATGARVTSIHTHPSFTCSGADGRSECRPGGVWQYDCTPSDLDSATYRHHRMPFALVQCDRHAFAPYFDPSVTSDLSRAPAPRGASAFSASRTALVVGAAFGAGLLDQDRGGYREPWGARATWAAQDKQAHSGVGFGLGALAGARAGCLAGAAFEVAQSLGGKGSIPDALVTCAGAVSGALLRKVWR